MSRIIKIVGLMALVAVFGVASLAAASPPVKPPIEGFYIETTTDISVLSGDLTESESFDWIYGDDVSFDARTLAMTAGSAAQIKYSEELTARKGMSSLYKPFTADSYNVANVDVGPKTITYYGDPLEDGATFDYAESIGIGIVSYGIAGAAAAGEGVLMDICPWFSPGADGITIPATNENIVAGSKVTAGVNVLAEYAPWVIVNTNSKATTTGMPELSYDIDANGFGSFEAYMDVHLQEGHAMYTAGSPQPPNLASETKYHESAKAVGVVDKFKKAMLYKSVYRP